MLALNEVHTYYGNSHILQGVNLQVKPREVVSLLGRNGAGKTTIIRSIIGFNSPRSGEVVYKQKNISSQPAYRISRLGIGLVPQGRGIFPTLSVRENLTLAARKTGGEHHWDLGKVYELFPRLKERENNKGNQLSGGEQQLLAIGRALMTNPDLLLLDEPSEGLAPLVVKDVGHIVGELKKQGLSILLVEQNLPLALGAADRVYVLSKGKIVLETTPAGLKDQDAEMKQYLGV
ncbi:MAG: ABC transporter ATP-binding protein [Carboxydocellales bacterium]